MPSNDKAIPNKYNATQFGKAEEARWLCSCVVRGHPGTLYEIYGSREEYITVPLVVW